MKPLQLNKIPLIAASLVALLLLGLPILVLLVRGVSLWDGTPDPGIPAAISLSLLTTIITALITILLGTPLAYIFARWRFPFKPLLNVLIELPIVLPPVVAGLALLITFGRRGLLGPTLQLAGIELPFSTAAVIIAQTFVSAPFYIRSAQIGFHNIPLEIEDAGRVDGAGGVTLFRHVTLPLALPSLAAGLTLSWARALGEFGATILFAGSSPGRTQTMPLLVYRIFEGNIDVAIWTSLILLTMALIALLISQWLTRRADS